jgi:hypothetical protein
MNTLWTVLETKITPRTLRMFADRLDRKMYSATVGEEVPKIELKDWNNKTNIVLIADQDAWHNRDRGAWK